MAVKVQVTRPTKMELTRLKRRLKLATRIQKIVKDRLSILVMEFMQTVRECASIKERLLIEFEEAYKGLSLATGYQGTMNLEQELMVSEKVIRVSAGTRNVAGVRMPIFEIEKSDSFQTMARPMIDTSSILDRSTELSQKCLETLIQMAELQNSLDLLGTEINKVKRVNNALEFIVIPGIDATIRYLAMKFEERDREEVARLKYVKQLIEKKEAYAF